MNKMFHHRDFQVAIVLSVRSLGGHESLINPRLFAIVTIFVFDHPSLHCLGPLSRLALLHGDRWFPLLHGNRWSPLLHNDRSITHSLRPLLCSPTSRFPCSPWRQVQRCLLGGRCGDRHSFRHHEALLRIGPVGIDYFISSGLRADVAGLIALRENPKEANDPKVDLAEVFLFESEEEQLLQREDDGIAFHALSTMVPSVAEEDNVLLPNSAFTDFIGKTELYIPSITAQLGIN